MYSKTIVIIIQKVLVFYLHVKLVLKQYVRQMRQMKGLYRVIFV